jgi:hypothetical protein
MGKCNACAGFPWDAGADLSLVPPVACHPALIARKWTPFELTAENECPYFKPAAKLTKKDAGGPGGDPPDADGGTKD